MTDPLPPPTDAFEALAEKVVTDARLVTAGYKIAYAAYHAGYDAARQQDEELLRDARDALRGVRNDPTEGRAYRGKLRLMIRDTLEALEARLGGRYV